MSNRTQLAAAAAYIPLTANVIAHQLKAELKADSHLLHVPVSISQKHIFDEDVYTPKVGGQPQWLCPDDLQVDVSTPTCKSCDKSMMLVTQLSVPFDFSEESAEMPLPSFCSASLGARQRHDRVLYVFACLQGRCANAPGTWCSKSICLSKSTHVAKEAVKYYDDKGDEYDDLSTDDENDNNNNFDHLKNTKITKNTVAPPVVVKEVKKEVKEVKKEVKKELFSVSGWSDSEEEDIPPTISSTQEEDITEPKLSDDIENAADVNMVQDTDMDYLKNLLARRDAEHTERELKVAQMKAQMKQLELEERKKQQELQKELAKDSIVATDVHQTIEVFRPFYLYWQEEPKALKPNLDHANTQQKEYMELHGDILPSSESKKTGKQGNPSEDLELDDEYEKTQDKTFIKFSASVERMPEQCIRYWPKEKLQLHETPSADLVNRMRVSMKKHKLEEFSSISGMWAIHEVPDCEHCGTPLHLEVQLMPNLLTELGLLDDDDYVAKKLGNTYFDWGMVDIYTCPLLCVQDEYITNYCAVHPSL